MLKEQGKRLQRRSVARWHGLMASVAPTAKIWNLVEGTLQDMPKSEEPAVKSYLCSKRARQLDLTAPA